MPISLPPPGVGLGTSGPGTGSGGGPTGGPSPQVTIGTGTSGPRGIEAVWEYNGLQMNVKGQVDSFRINSINGIDDADVRDSREVRPAAHGEIPFNAFYGGRTIVLQGKIVSLNLFKLRDMQQILRQSFADLTEKPLIIRSLDPDTDLMINCRKSQPIQMAEEQQTATQFERAFQITLRASNPRWVAYLRKFISIPLNAGNQTRIISNIGNFQAQPQFILYGPLGVGTTIINSTTGKRFILAKAILNGEAFTLDVEKSSMKNNSTQANAFDYINVTSDEVELAPGNNTIDVTVVGGGANSVLEIYWRDTYL